MKHRILLLFFLSFMCTLKAQQPAYYILGEDHFKGVQIYDVIQDKQQNYWFATNEGLYVYNFYNFTKIECSEAKSSSVFNFVINKDGIIFCHNLNNQIFKISENKCTLFYELSKEDTHPDVSLCITNNNNLIIGARDIIVLNSIGKEVNRYKNPKHYLGPPAIIQTGKIAYHLSGCDSIVINNGDRFLKEKLDLNTKTLETNSVFKFFKINDQRFALDLFTKCLYSFNESNFELGSLKNNPLFKRSESVRLYETGESVWIAGTLPGTGVLNEKTVELESPVYYQNFFISDIFKDREGNLLLSTFDKGVLVIPDQQIPDVINTFHDDPIASIYADSELGLLLGSSKGKLLVYTKDEGIKSINTSGKRPIESIHGNENSELILFDDGFIRCYNKKTKIITDIVSASLKDAVVLSEQDFFIGTNRGVYKGALRDQQIAIELIPNLNFRVYALAYDTKEKGLYVASSNGLFYYDTSGQISKITFNNQEVFPNSLSYKEGKIYATEKKNGLLIIEKEKIIHHIQPKIAGTDEHLNKTFIFKNTIIGKSTNGLFQFDMNGKYLRSLHTIFGFNSKRILDFTFQNETLWVSHAGGVQAIDLNYSKDVTPPPLRFDFIKVNDKTININTNRVFESEQRKFEFTVCSPTLRNQEPIRYQYKLVGYDKDWNINNPGSNTFTYNALEAGNYTLLVRLENNAVPGIPISYSFSISKPFYLKWWFILSYVSVFLLLVYLMYRWQLARQRKKSEQINELNASKLTAIQSQMNPHFIFNSLNSIQDLVLKGDVENSYSYITTFSNLVRRTLNYSEKDFIDFEQEIKLLELYLSLEKLRFKKELNYTIQTNNITDILIPPLLIQPFVENALIHGLLHKDGEKRLHIHFELKNVLICTIEDNGVGREKAKAIKQRQRSEHESFSGKAIHKRFEILSNVFDGAFGYEYEDLYENKDACGTRVILKIPIKHKF
ncbi:MAG: histidine kinase [Bacteroidetes bacterium]|nr:histidine kinase [Bacteroidota bacterium]